MKIDVLTLDGKATEVTASNKHRNWQNWILNNTNI